MAEPFSNLEVAPNERTEQVPELHDDAAHAPEAVHASDTLEHDKKSWPLPVSPRSQSSCNKVRMID